MTSSSSRPSPCQLVVKSAYENIVDTVMSNVRDSFLDEGVDLQVLEDLRALWTSKMKSSNAVINIETDNSRFFGGVGQSKHFKGGEQYNLDSLSNSGCPSAIAVIRPDPRALVPIHITLPKLPGDADGVVRKIDLKVRAALLQNNLLQGIMSKPEVQAMLELPLEIATTELQKLLDVSQSGVSQLSNSTGKRRGDGETSGDASSAVKRLNRILQSDGNYDDSSDNSGVDEAKDEDSYDEEFLGPRDQKIEIKYEQNELPDELVLVQDVKFEAGTEDFDNVENMVMCTTDKIFRKGDKCTFHLRDGIMNLNGKDYVFLKAQGEAEW